MLTQIDEIHGATKRPIYKPRLSCSHVRVARTSMNFIINHKMRIKLALVCVNILACVAKMMLAFIGVCFFMYGLVIWGLIPLFCLSRVLGFDQTNKYLTYDGAVSLLFAYGGIFTVAFLVCIYQWLNEYIDRHESTKKDV